MTTIFGDIAGWSLTEWLGGKMYESTVSVQQEVYNSAYEIYSKAISSIFELLATIIMVYMIWCCYTLMMGRQEVNAFPFGRGEVIQTLYFLSIFYTLLRLIEKISL
jgi:hypothetical protein